MPQRLTFDPLKLKTGDKVCFLLTVDNSQNLFMSMKPVFCTVMEIKETIVKIDALRLKRNFQIKLHADQNQKDGKYEYTADQRSPIFMSLQELIADVKDKLRHWEKAQSAHNGRQENLLGTLYEHDDDEL